jgi:hypothetical protein
MRRCSFAIGISGFFLKSVSGTRNAGEMPQDAGPCFKSFKRFFSAVIEGI